MKKIISVLAVFMVMMAFSTGGQAQSDVTYKYKHLKAYPSTGVVRKDGSFSVEVKGGSVYFLNERFLIKERIDGHGFILRGIRDGKTYGIRLDKDSALLFIGNNNVMKLYN